MTSSDNALVGREIMCPHRAACKNLNLGQRHESNKVQKGPQADGQDRVGFITEHCRNRAPKSEIHLCAHLSLDLYRKRVDNDDSSIQGRKLTVSSFGVKGLVVLHM
jgi:hypothetical protein